MSRSSANFLATESERIADADLDLAYLRHVARDVASRLTAITAAMCDTPPSVRGALADVAIRLNEVILDLRYAAEEK